MKIINIEKKFEKQKDPRVIVKRGLEITLGKNASEIYASDINNDIENPNKRKV